MREHPSRAPVSVFYSYAHADEALREQLETHLSLLRRQGLISEWHDREILPGAEWGREIDEHLERASIILLLISADFLASNYCSDIELQRALERHKRGEARVIPIILRPCDWKTSPFAQLQCLPRHGKAVTTWQNQDEAFLVIAEGLRRVIERQQVPLRPLPEVERKNRRSLIKRVWAIWIKGVLEHSLHQAALIALDLQEQPDALANPWQFEVQETNLPPRPLPAGTPLVQVYDEAEGELLILGEPGAGKTTLLLQLAQTLLERAEHREQECLPVVFNLSSWAQKRLPLTDWLVEELNTKYQVPRKVGQVWIDIDQVLPLLDGLDEVAEDARPGCVQAINTYYQRASTQLVVCCRSQEYMALPTRVTLHRAVSIQLLTDEQIGHYLQSAGGQLEALRQALQDDAELYELARRPLMLSIFTLAYQRAAPEELPTRGAGESQQRQAMATYVEKMLHRRGNLRTGRPAHMVKWLTWLAWQMIQHNQSVFYVEHIRLNWLYRLPHFLREFFSSLQLIEKVTPMIVTVGRRRYVYSVAQPQDEQDEKARLTPNQGIWRSARNGLPKLVFLVCFSVLFLGACLLTQWPFENPFTETLIVLFLGFFLVSGLFFGLFDGLGAFVDHFLVRLWLWRTDCLPWNLVAFLDEAAERLLLRKVGGGYIFIHRLLLDYFASLEATPASTEGATRPEPPSTTP